ncbi:hypothetical protein [Vibrio atypicus]|uniref:hypothetical protein n=1 Tax=Vibrio atypicus TaxID=558271 RepID=UPI0013596510|nr:hypothetical protein [Vibrio atypicus]
MKVAYLIEGEIDTENPSSVLCKILRKTKIWTSKGHTVLVYSLRTGNYLDVCSLEVVTLGKKYTLNSTAISKLFIINYNAYKFFQHISNQSFDLMYSRLITYTPHIELLFRKIPTILEINSYEKKEYSGAAYSTYTRIYNSVLGDRLKNTASAYVFVTNELAALYRRDLKNIPRYCVIANGYDFGRVPSLNESVSCRVSLAFIVSPGLPWHGLDHLIELAKSLPEYDFHVVGETGSNTLNVFYHGYKTGSELDEILSNSHIGIASLALERAGLSEACPLKSREYFNYGLPCFGSYVDTDFFDASSNFNPVYKQIANIEDYDKSKKEIKQFVESWIKQSPYKNDVRRNAMLLLDDRVKERRRLELFSEICQRR